MKLKQHLKKWLQKVDESDQQLSQYTRKIKWIGILGTLFILYVLSFMVGREKPSFSVSCLPLPTAIRDSTELDSLLHKKSFTLPTDSFEQLLNQHIHENTHSEK